MPGYAVGLGSRSAAIFHPAFETREPAKGSTTSRDWFRRWHRDVVRTSFRQDRILQFSIFPEIAA